MTDRPRDQQLAHLVLETFPTVMGYVGGYLRREAPVKEQQHFHVLRVLVQAELSLSELATASGVRLPTMSRTVQAMVRHGWVERFHAPENRRTVYVRMAEAGRAALAETERLALDRVSLLLDNLELGEKASLAGALACLAEAMDERNTSFDC